MFNLLWYARYTHHNSYWLRTNALNKYVAHFPVWQFASASIGWFVLTQHEPTQFAALWLRCVCFIFALSFSIPSQCSSLNPVFCIVCCWFLNFLYFSFFFGSCCTNNIVCSCGQRLKFLWISGYAHISLKSWVNEMWQLNCAKKKWFLLFVENVGIELWLILRP